MSDLLCLLVLIVAVPVTAAWGWTGWFLLLGAGELVFGITHQPRYVLVVLGALFLMALAIELMIKRTGNRRAVPEGIIRKAVISGGTQLALGSLFHILAAVVVWWMGLGRFLWEQPVDERKIELKNARKWAILMLARVIGAFATAVVILWFS